MKKRKVINIVLIIMVAIVFILAIAYLAPIMKDISTKEGQIAFKEKIENLGIVGLLILFGLEVAQIFLVIIPGEPLEILAGMCFRKYRRNNIYNNICFYNNSNIILFSKKIWKEICI